MIKTPKKIVQVLYSGLGGHGTVAFSLLEGFVANKSENYLIFYGIEPINKDYITNIKAKKEVKDYYGILKKTKLGIKEWIQYYKYLQKINPTIVLLHSNQLILVTYLYSLFNKVKIITVEHDAIAVRTKSKWLVSNLNAILAKQIVVLNQDYKKHIQKNLWFSSLLKKYVIIPNGINSDTYKQKDTYFQKNAIIIFMASRMNKLRDHQTLIEAVSLAQNKYANIKLRIAGDGDTLSVLKNKYNELAFVEFLGNIDEKEILNEFHLADIYVHATFAETFSTAILQAMSCGLPIITSDIEGTRHMITNRQNGLLYGSKDTEDLNKQIDTILSNKEFAIKLGQNARTTVVTRYTSDAVTAAYLKLFG